MAKNMQPYLKRCRTLGISPAVMGVNKESNRNPGPQRRPKKSEYALQLTEKQKVKFVYGVLEKQFRAYYEKAARMKGNTGDELMTLLERRLDNVVFRLGLAAPRREARRKMGREAARLTAGGPGMVSRAFSSICWISFIWITWIPGICCCWRCCFSFSGKTRTRSY
nr:30S ribosomal protein S4 [uncultured Oscillibacter sp.]